jgi:hypothetical protein
MKRAWIDCFNYVHYFEEERQITDSCSVREMSDTEIDVEGRE